MTMLLAGLFFEYSGILHIFTKEAVMAICFVFIGRKAQIVTAFLFGVIAYQFRYKIPYDRFYFYCSLFVITMSAFLCGLSQMDNMSTRLVLLPTLAYITLFVGLTKIKLPKYFKNGDYSYGIYLYHYPILQVVISIFPGIAAVKFFGGVFVFFVSIPFVVLWATFSWHFVEKPFLALRKKFSFVARVRGVNSRAINVFDPGHAALTTISTARFVDE